MDRPVRWAFAAADRRTGPRNHEPPFRRDGILVTRAVPNHPFGRSTHTRAFLTHIVAAVYLAWRDGRLAGTHARWQCGGGAYEFRLVAEPDSVVCPACHIVLLPRPG